MFTSKAEFTMFHAQMRFCEKSEAVAAQSEPLVMEIFATDTKVFWP